MDTSNEARPQLSKLNEHIVCPLCRGYLIDATTLVECLHSFCRGCIVRRLSSGARVCPVCNVTTLPPLLPDVKLQRLVYLLVPGLLKAELEKRRHFRLVNPQCSVLLVPIGVPELTFDDLVSVSLQEVDTAEDREPKILNDENRASAKGSVEEEKEKIRYLKCPAGVTVRHLQRLLMLKRGWNDSEDTTSSKNRIELLCQSKEDAKAFKVLNPSWTLLDLACIFEWERVNETPLKLLYRVVGNGEGTSKSCFEAKINNDPALQVMEDIQRPPTPPPSPKPMLSMSSQLKDMQSRTSNPADTAKEPESKKPRCEVTPVMRTPDPLETSEQNSKKVPKMVKMEHHKRRKRRNKRVIAEITTTPREDMLKLKVRLTPCPPRVTASEAKDKLLQVRAIRRDKMEAKAVFPPSASSHHSHSEKEDDSDEETLEQIIDSIPDEVMEIDDIFEKDADKVSKTGRTAEPPSEDKPKDEEVLRQLGLVNNQGMDREKLEKQLKESKANRVRSLLAEKQMRDTLESIKNIGETKTKDVPAASGNAKKKGPPPLAPLRAGKASTSTFNSMARFKSETPLDLSNAGSKNGILDLSSTPKTPKNSSCARPAAKSDTSDKMKEHRKSQDSNLRTLSNAAVSLISCEKKPEAPTSIPKIGNKVALRIPQPHQRISGFGIKMKPNLGIRHIPNPQAIVASQFRNQGSGFFASSHRPQ